MNYKFYIILFSGFVHCAFNKKISVKYRKINLFFLIRTNVSRILVGIGVRFFYLC